MSLMLHPSINCSEGREEPDPRIMPTFQYLLSVLVSRFLELRNEGRDGVMLVKEWVAQQQQAPLLGREQEHQPHHDCECGPVEFGLGDARQQFPALLPGRSGRVPE